MATVASRGGWDVVLAGRGREDGPVEAALGDVRVLRWPVRPEPALSPKTSARLVEALLRYPSPSAGRAAGRRVAAERRRAQERAAARAVRARERAARARVAAVLQPVARAATLGAAVGAVARTRVHRSRWAATQSGLVGEAESRRTLRRLAEAADVLDLELGPRVEELTPDAVWAVGSSSLDVAAGAVQRLRLLGRRVRLVYDAREDVEVRTEHPGEAALRTRLERHAVAAVDVIVAPTGHLARVLTSRYPDSPVRLVPDTWLGREHREPVPGVRGRVEVPEGAVVLAVPDADQPAAVAQLTALVEAVAETGSVHLALLVGESTAQLRTVRDAAWLRGMRPRWHQVTGVDRLELREVLAGASAAVVLAPRPAQSAAALPQAYPAALAAGVPVLTHATRVLHRQVEDDGSGVVVDLEDPAAVRSALHRLLGSADLLAHRLRDREVPAPDVEAVLDALGPRPAVGPSARAPATPRAIPSERRLTPVPETRVLGVGPANFAGQGWAWARAARAALPGLRTDVFAVEQGALTFPADRRIPRRSLQSLTWQLQQQERILRGYTHLLAEANRPVFGRLNGDELSADLPALRRAGVVVGIALHGSEVRDPHAHRRRERWSPFQEDDEFVENLAHAVARTKAVLAEFDGPVFVSTPDLLDDAPQATWLPVVVDVAVPHDAPLLERDVPVVVHAPSSARLKGSAAVDGIVQRLHREGVCEYRRVSGVAPQGIPAVLAEADVVLDQFAIGSYGVLACEGMAAGRVVVGHVRPEVRERVGRPLPIVEATPEDLEEVLRGLFADRDAARVAAAQGRRFVEDVHDGRTAGSALVEQLLARPA